MNLTDAESAYWREREAGNTKSDRDGYYHDGFVDGYAVGVAAASERVLADAEDAIGALIAAHKHTSSESCDLDPALIAVSRLRRAALAGEHPADPGSYRPSLVAAAVADTTPADNMSACHCPPFIDGGVLRRQDCPHHPPRREQVEPAPEPMSDERIEAACAWADYRKDFGVNRDDLAAAHKAFLAGWKAAREGDQSAVLR